MHIIWPRRHAAVESILMEKLKTASSLIGLYNDV